MIRLLLADDQALVRGALAALLALEPDLEVVAEVGSGDAVVAYDEDALRQCVSNLLPSFRWTEAPQPDNVVVLRRSESGEK